MIDAHDHIWKHKTPSWLQDQFFELPRAFQNTTAALTKKRAAIFNDTAARIHRLQPTRKGGPNGPANSRTGLWRY